MINKRVAVLLLVIMGLFSLFGTVDAASSRYFTVQSDMNQITDVDLDSIKMIRAQPPFYIIDATIMHGNYSTNEFGGTKVRYYYNYKTQEIKSQKIAIAVLTKGGWSYSDEYEDMRDVKKGSISEYIAKGIFFRMTHMYFSDERFQ